MEWTKEQWEELNRWCEEHHTELEEHFAKSQLRHSVWGLRRYGYLTVREMPGLSNGESGEHYVYLWKHNGGAPFYVGSGTGRRAASVSARREEFHEELSIGDCILWYVVGGISKNLSRRIEAFCSMWLSSRGYKLCNRDFYIRYMSAMKRCEHYDDLNEEWFAPELSDRLVKILAAVEVDFDKADNIVNEFKRTGGRFDFQSFHEIYMGDRQREI